MSAEPRAAARQGYYPWVTALRSHAGTTGLKPGVVAVLAMVATYADPQTGDNARPATTTLAEGLGIRRETVSRALAEGLARGWLDVVARPTGRPVVYALSVPDVAHAVRTGSRGRAPALTGGVRTGSRGRAPALTGQAQDRALDLHKTDLEAHIADVWAQAEVLMQAKAEADSAAALDWWPDPLPI